MRFVSMSVIALARGGNPLRTGAVGPFLMFLYDVNVVMFTNFVGKWIIMACWKVILSACDILFVDDRCFDITLTSTCKGFFEVRDSLTMTSSLSF